jgi:hypothetical protein
MLVFALIFVIMLIEHICDIIAIGMQYYDRIGFFVLDYLNWTLWNAYLNLHQIMDFVSQLESLALTG